MLKRIRQITGVGCYGDCRSPRVEFKPLTFIYGENSYGKSTLCDIFRSISENQPKYITDRKSIPETEGVSQQLQLNIVLPGEDVERTFLFNRGNWNPILPQGLRILVFDTDFINRNVFTGYNIERQNQENITQFILGEESVQTAQTIARLKASQREVTRDIGIMKNGVFKEIPDSDMKTYIALAVDKSLEKIEKLIQEKVVELQTEKSLSQNLINVSKRAEPVSIPSLNNLKAFVAEVNRIFTSTYTQVHQQARIKLLEHISNHTQMNFNTEHWIHQGYQLMKDSLCPFCGREFEGNSYELLEAYQTVFNSEFESFIDENKQALDGIERTFNEFGYKEVATTTEFNSSTFNLYPELNQGSNFGELLLVISEVELQLKQLIEQWNYHYSDAKEKLETCLKAKRQAIHLSTESWDCLCNCNVYEQLSEVVTKYNECLVPIIEVISQFKKGLNDERVAERIRLKEKELRQLKQLQHRLIHDEDCEHYKDLLIRKKQLENEIPQKQQQLEREQTDFLDTYFQAINTIFNQLGSNKFTISKRVSNRGNLPTIQIETRFMGIEVTPDRLHAIYSESDRRALALSVFWAKVQLLTEEKKANTIVVLDDPVTSFDDGRIDRTIRFMEFYQKQLRQVIVLSHYPSYLKSFFERVNSQNTLIQLAQIRQTQNGSQIESANPIEFVENLHQRAFRKIKSFIEHEHDDDILLDLRIYLETEVQSRYYKQIVEHNLGNCQFCALLNELNNLQVLDQRVREKIEQLRLTLNTDHHVWTDRRHEEKIAIANDVLDFIYNEL